MKGVYEIGNIRKTNGQIKKHESQMNEEEKIYIEKKIRKIDVKDIKLSHHLRKKKKDIGFKIKDILDTLKSEDLQELIIEYNETPMRGKIDRRVLLRGDRASSVEFKSGDRVFFSPANICFVISLDTSQIITVYWNKVSDTHKTINWNRYDKNLDIIKR